MRMHKLNNTKYFHIPNLWSAKQIPDLFFSIFVAIRIFLEFWSDNFTYPLTQFSNRVIGISTFKMIDVSARLSAFYKALFFGLFAFLISFLLYRIFSQKLKSLRTELKFINYLSLTGIFALLFSVFGINMYITYLTILGLIGFFLVFSPLKYALNSSKLRSGNDYLWLIITAFSLSFAQVILTEWIIQGHFVFNFLIFLTLITLLVHLFHGSSLQNIAWKLRLFIFIPLIFVFSQELFLIFNQHDKFFIPPRILTLILFTGLFLIEMIKNPASGKFKLLNRNYIPCLVLSIIVFGNYQIYITLQNDLFEIGNPAVAMMNIFQHGNLPVADFLPTHLLSDFLTPVLYTIFNGYDNTFSFVAYHFIYHSLFFFFGFMLLFKITKNKYLMLAIVLCFPFMSTLFWSDESFLLIIIPLLIHYVYINPGFKSWIFYFIFSILILTWRPDTALMGIYAMIIGAIIIWWKHYKKLRISHFIFAFAIPYFSLILSLVTLEIVFNFPVKEGITNTLSFFSSSPQARGLPVIAREFDRIFFWHHIIYPILIIGIGIFVLTKFRRMNDSNRLLIFSLFIFVMYYLVNIQRGLTRHSFAEGHDGFISSFAIVSISLAMLFLPWKRLNKQIGVFVLAAFLAIMMKFPNQANDYILYGKAIETLKANFHYSGKTQIQRAGFSPEFYNTHVSEMESFFHPTSNPANFYDFSNTPALYYICQREFPGYFIHSLAITSESLQEMEVERLKSKHIPYLIYSHIPMNWWDNTDGVPNTVRFYKIAEYLFQHYQPNIIVGNYAVWEHIDFQAVSEQNYPEDSISDEPLIYNMQYLPYLWAEYDEAYQNLNLDTMLLAETQANLLKISGKVDKSKGNYVEITVKNPELISGEAVLRLFKKYEQFGEFKFQIPGNKTEERFVIRVSTQYNWYAQDINRIKVITPNSMHVSRMRLLKAD
jgi:hypothetical protein